jgi:hypothetical protein
MLKVKVISISHRLLRGRSISLVALSLFVLFVLPPAEMKAASRLAAGLLPATTKGFLSIPDITVLRSSWNKSELGKLCNDPAMQPLLEDVNRQSDSGFGWLTHLGLRWSDLQDMQSGEIALAVVQPDGDKKQHARAILVDFGTHRNEARAMWAAVSKRLREQGAIQKAVKTPNGTVHRFVLPKKSDDSEPREIYFAASGTWFVATNHRRITEQILANADLAADAKNTLLQSPAFRACMRKTHLALGQYPAHLRWFVEPFGMVEVVRAACSRTSGRGVDYLAVLRNQGFDAIQGVGGAVAFATGQHEALQHTFVYAPGAADGSSNFKLAARMLEFPNEEPQTPATWVPDNIATYVGANWYVKDAFRFMETLVNELADDEIFEDMMNDIANDPAGPQLDIRKDVVAHFADHVTVMFGYNRNMLVIELAEAEPVAAAFAKSMSVEGYAKKHVVQGQVVWQLLDDAENIEDPMAFDFEGDELADEVQEGNPLLQFNAVCVAYNHLILATHFDAIENLLNRAAEGHRLTGASDYQTVTGALKQLEAGKESFRFFVRTSDTLRAAYDALREVKVSTLQLGLGTLNIESKKLPDYGVIERHSGPAGFYLRTEQDGWLISGCLLPCGASANGALTVHSPRK